MLLTSTNVSCGQCLGLIIHNAIQVIIKELPLNLEAARILNVSQRRGIPLAYVVILNRAGELSNITQRPGLAEPSRITSRECIPVHDIEEVTNTVWQLTVAVIENPLEPGIKQIRKVSRCTRNRHNRVSLFGLPWVGRFDDSP